MGDKNTTNTKSRPLNRFVQFIWYLTAIIEILLAVRFFLKLFGANPFASFTEFIYNITQPLITPFEGVFGATRANGYVFEWTTLLAMFVYWLIARGIIALIVISKK